MVLWFCCVWSGNWGYGKSFIFPFVLLVYCTISAFLCQVIFEHAWAGPWTKQALLWSSECLKRLSLVSGQVLRVCPGITQHIAHISWIVKCFGTSYVEEMFFKVPLCQVVSKGTELIACVYIIMHAFICISINISICVCSRYMYDICVYICRYVHVCTYTHIWYIGDFLRLAYRLWSE